ncbi:MAG: mraZ [Verrucomicrobiota bacterium]
MHNLFTLNQMEFRLTSGIKWSEMGQNGELSLMSELHTGTFVGEFRHNLDDKGRLTIPSAWRPPLERESNDFLALPSLDGPYVTVLPPKMIAQLEERISQISMGDAEGRRAVRRVMQKAHRFSCDKQGRINLNDKLVDYAKLKKSAVLLGEISTFSIYSAEAYDQLNAEDDDDMSSYAEDFRRLGL